MRGIDFHRRFQPLTAHPFDPTDCTEHPPCAALQPYVRCFWGPQALHTTLVVPDACADVIIRMDCGMEISFCPVDNTPFTSHRPTWDLFAVRFYLWSLPAVTGGAAFGEEAFPGLAAHLLREDFPGADFAGRQRIMERYLLARLRPEDASPVFLCAMDRMLRTCGRECVGEAAAREAVSVRTLERLFHRSTGLSPKEAAEVVRYQTLWRRSLLQPRFDVQDQVEALGFCDQAHLLNTFRRFHTTSLREAVRRARDVAFLQDGGDAACYAAPWRCER